MAQSLCAGAERERRDTASGDANHLAYVYHASYRNGREEVIARQPLRAWLKSIHRDKFKQAGLVYLIAGLLVISFTFLTQLVPNSRVAATFLIFPGSFFVVVFAILVYVGPLPRGAPPPRHSWDARRLSAVSIAIQWVARTLAATNAVRAVLFLFNALGQNIHLTFSPIRVFVVVSHAEPLFFVNAVLVALVAFMLARAGWNLLPGQSRTLEAS